WTSPLMPWAIPEEIKIMLISRAAAFLLSFLSLPPCCFLLQECPACLVCLGRGGGQRKTHDEFFG
ncbi:MAG: hypothetical protein SV775_17540, partial [Thermodesulfobacteriota bacterium]|nr:hypothetical protein [Thermodesulfobacteriota bacterium]